MLLMVAQPLHWRQDAHQDVLSDQSCSTIQVQERNVGYCCIVLEPSLLCKQGLTFFLAML